MAARIFHPLNPLLLRKSPPDFHHRFRAVSNNHFSKFSVSHNHFTKFTVSHNHFSKFIRSPHLSISCNFVDRLLSDNQNFTSAAADDGGSEVAVVLLGWLGAKPKHLKRYAQLYNDKGIHAVTYVSSVADVLFGGKTLEQRINTFTNELVFWLSAHRHRCLIFHTFSNTGWLTYGAILSHLRDRQDLLDKIRGCVVDSGGDPIIDPKVWAAGFTTALLKKRSSATYTSPESELGSAENGSKIEKKEPDLIETTLLFAFEKLFSFFLNLPDVNRRLAKIVSVLSEDQPACPQLYLYSSNDRVIPFQRVESFLEEQRRIGRRVSSFDFGSSPHVDHYRTFPDIYSSQLHNFLKECSIMVGKS